MLGFVAILMVLSQWIIVFFYRICMYGATEGANRSLAGLMILLFFFNFLSFCVELGKYFIGVGRSV